MTAQTLEIAEEVRAAIARRKVKQTDIAEIIGLSQAGVSRRLSGASPFSATELGVIAKFLGVSVATFYKENVA